MKRIRSHLRGFTLLELLLALAGSAALVVLLLVVARNALDLWATSSRNLRQSVQADAILDRVQADLETALFRRDDAVWLAATVLTDGSLSGWWSAAPGGKPVGASLDLAPVDITQCRFGIGGVWLRCFIPSRQDGSTGVRAVGYQLVRREAFVGSGETAYLLHRAEVSASNTFSAGYNLDPVSGGYRQRNATPGHPGNLIRPPLSSVIGDHVVDFGLRLYRQEHDRLERVFPVDGGPEYLATSAGERWPRIAEIMIRLLDDTGVRRLAAIESGADPAAAEVSWWDVVERHSRVYVRRVVLPEGE